MEFDLHKQILDNLSDGVTVQDRNFNILYQNKSMIDASGGYAGRKCYECYENRDEVCEGCGVSKVFETGRPHTVIRTAFLKTDESSCWENACFPLFDETGEIVAGVEVCRDISKRVSLEKEVTNRSVKLAQLNKQLKRQTKCLETTMTDLRTTHTRLLEASRLAGMADVAVGVMHNVGNVLNSVNVSAELVVDRIRDDKTARMEKLADLVRSHEADLCDFLVNDPRGSLIPEYLEQLALHMREDRSAALAEMRGLLDKIEHIREIVAVQQDFARASGVLQFVEIKDIVADAVSIHQAALERHHVEVQANFDEMPPVFVDRHKVLQILINLISNAKYAMDENGSRNRLLVIRARKNGDHADIEIADNGIGIERANLESIFSYGFTTRRDGHGFGLHNAALTARELKGALKAESEGVGKGSVFTLSIPFGGEGG